MAAGHNGAAPGRVGSATGRDRQNRLDRTDPATLPLLPMLPCISPGDQSRGAWHPSCPGRQEQGASFLLLKQRCCLWAAWSLRVPAMEINICRQLCLALPSALMGCKFPAFPDLPTSTPYLVATCQGPQETPPPAPAPAPRHVPALAALDAASLCPECIGRRALARAPLLTDPPPQRG